MGFKKICLFALHKDWSNADFALHMEGSHADSAPHMKLRHCFRDKKLQKLQFLLIFKIICLKPTLGVYMTNVTKFENTNKIMKNYLNNVLSFKSHYEHWV